MKKIKAALFFMLFVPSFLLAQATVADSADSASNDFFANAITDYIDYSRKLSFNLFIFSSNLEGKMAVGDKGNPTAKPAELISLDNNLKFDDELSFGIGLNWQYAGRTSLDIKYSEFEHKSLLAMARTFKGKSFKANSNFEVKNRWLDIAFAKKLYRTEKDVVDHFNLQAVAGIKTANIIITARGEESGTTDKHLYAGWEKTFPMPYVGFNGNIRLGRSVLLKGHCLYGTFPTFDDYSADHYDLGVNLVFDLHQKEHGNLVQLDLGYKALEYDVDGHGNGVLMRFSGPVAYCNIIF